MRSRGNRLPDPATDLDLDEPIAEKYLRTPKSFIEEVRGDDPDLASYLRIEEREALRG